ncbi:hypothetical protein ACLOJK_024172, partial [Asimina triloba]
TLPEHRFRCSIFSKSANPAAIEDPSSAALRSDPSGSNPPLAADGEQSIGSHGRVRSIRPIQRSIWAGPEPHQISAIRPKQRVQATGNDTGQQWRTKPLTSKPATNDSSHHQPNTPTSRLPPPAKNSNKPIQSRDEQHFRPSDPNQQHHLQATTHVSPPSIAPTDQPTHPGQMHSISVRLANISTIAHQISDLIYDPLSSTSKQSAGRSHQEGVPIFSSLPANHARTAADRMPKTRIGGPLEADQSSHGAKNPQPAVSVPKTQSDGERRGTTIIVFNNVSIQQQQQHQMSPGARVRPSKAASSSEHNSHWARYLVGAMGKHHQHANRIISAVHNKAKNA